MSFETVMPPFNASDPAASFLSSSCLDFLLIELVPMAYRVANTLEAQAAEDRAVAPPLALAAAVAAAVPSTPVGGGAGTAAGAAAASGGGSAGGASIVSPAVGAAQPAAPGQQQQQHQPLPPSGPASGGAVASSGSVGGAASSRRMDEDEERDAVFFRLEMLGYRVGQGLVERFSRDRPRFTDTLDVIKFLCKDLWTLVFRKQVDNLKTNHRGVYVLTDNAFRPFSRMSTEAGGQAVVRAQPFLWFPCGVVRGALAALGITATVQAETSELPGAVFQIKTIPSSA